MHPKLCQVLLVVVYAFCMCTVGGVILQVRAARITVFDCMHFITVHGVAATAYNSCMHACHVLLGQVGAYSLQQSSAASRVMCTCWC
jgi:hypothetical protein